MLLFRHVPVLYRCSNLAQSILQRNPLLEAPTHLVFLSFAGHFAVDKNVSLGSDDQNHVQNDDISDTSRRDPRNWRILNNFAFYCTQSQSEIFCILLYPVTK